MTDKYSSGLYDVYKELLLPYEHVSLLEIGTTHDSLMMFEKLLPLAEVHGFDRNPPGLNRAVKAVAVTINQDDGKAIEEFAVKHGGFDIVIEAKGLFELNSCDCLSSITRERIEIEVGTE